ncbi:thioredoxin fold domain-containing protein [Pedobacter sp. G11]|uniref:thioredoxin family protein n=1 Tax=Pedobacter sp. G11 TaxID=2482728 RepID=UPI00143CC19C|nr:thioredoxin fold domain-containing protein [Pedobacter sp. G11]
MMKRLLIVIAILSSIHAWAQQGIKFEETLNWEQIKAKAKKENSYIFIDAYATWCVPCKEMSAKIFSKQEIGDFYNKNFINVAIQFDRKSTDNKRIKEWYNDAKKIKDNFKILAYPTYLYFNPNGELVYKIVGANYDPTSFLENTKLALDTKTQYPTLKDQFVNGKRDTAFLATLIKAGINSSDMKSLPTFINSYLKSQTNLLTKQNIIYIFYGTQSTTDFGFETLQKHSEAIDSVIGKGFSRKTVNRLIFNETVFPMLKTNAVIKNYGGGMIDYQGDLNKSVDWQTVSNLVKNKFPDRLEEVNRFSKTLYYQWAEDWTKYAEVVSEYLEKKPNQLNPDELSDYTEVLFQFSNDSSQLQKAESWSKLSMASKGTDPIRYKVINTRLLYKNGKKAEAITQMQSVIDSLGQTSGQLVDEVNKMKNNEKTWF